MTSTAAGHQLIHPYLLFWGEMMSRAVRMGRVFTRRQAPQKQPEDILGASAGLQEVGRLNSA